jgi:hypothetical protein
MNKSKPEIKYTFAETRIVLTEKAPFGVLIKHEFEEDYDEEPYLVRKCISFKELMSGFKKGLDWEDKRKFNDKYLNPKSIKYKTLFPKDFYIVVKGFSRNEIGRPLRISHTRRVGKVLQH